MKDRTDGQIARIHIRIRTLRQMILQGFQVRTSVVSLLSIRKSLEVNNIEI